VDILTVLTNLHSVWRYAVLIAAVVAIVAGLAAWLGSLPPRLTARRAGLLYIIAIDIQVLLGVILWVGKGWYATPGFYRAEHPATMLLAMIVAHAGQVISRRAKSPKAAAGAVTIAVMVSLALVIVGLPGIVRGG
jgi:hypothetical protein